MNEAEKANPESDVFLKQVRLKKYKSIVDAEIDFKPGLNIIIGNNGSGKTNFLSYSYDVINVEWDDKQFLSGEFTFSKKRELLKTIVSKKVETDRKGSLEKPRQEKNRFNIQFYHNDEKVEESQKTSFDFLFFIFEKVNYRIRQIQYGIPKEQFFTEKSLNITFTQEENHFTIDDFSLNQPFFIRSLYHFIEYSVYSNKDFNIDAVAKIIEGLNNLIANIKGALLSVTDIKDLRISPNFNIYTLNLKANFSVQNLFIEFELNNIWLPFTNLSDGNKRLFYIISEILSYDEIDIMNNVDGINKLRNVLKIILLEEPELGIHPHQLHKLMLFIKEQSREKQIILTTHSPQVLNILNADELDRIIICSYDQQKGTQLNHLTESQIKKGQMYMRDEGFLSDYWVHSDLESVS